MVKSVETSSQFSFQIGGEWPAPAEILPVGMTPGEHTRQKGQALVEAAISIPILLIILWGVVEFGWAYFVHLALQDAAAEGAAFGSFHATWWDDDASLPENRREADPNNIVYRVQNESGTAWIDWSDTAVDVEAPFPTPGNNITVTVSYNHTLLTPLVQEIAGDTSITLRATAIQTILWTDDPVTPP